MLSLLLKFLKLPQLLSICSSEVNFTIFLVFEDLEQNCPDEKAQDILLVILNNLPKNHPSFIEVRGDFRGNHQQDISHPSSRFFFMNFNILLNISFCYHTFNTF